MCPLPILDRGVQDALSPLQYLQPTLQVLGVLSDCPKGRGQMGGASRSGRFGNVFNEWNVGRAPKGRAGRIPRRRPYD